MTCRSLLALVAVAACAPHGEPPAIQAPPRERFEPIAKGAPHGSHIVELAITDEADAALTFDSAGGLRLWPSFDGTRPPVAIGSDAPKQLALAHAGRDLLAAVLDDAGSVRVLRLGRDGTIRARAQLPGEYLQVVAFEGSVLVRTVDHAIEWYAADGTARGRVVADASEHLHSLAARRGYAIALVGDAQKGVGDRLRWLVFGASLAWGERVSLPVAARMLALSPSHRRVAVVDPSNTLHVYDIDPVVSRETGSLVEVADASMIGFIDDDHVVAAGSALQLWSATPPEDPWDDALAALPQPTQMGFANRRAIGDGMVVSASGPSLALVDRGRVRYLGWKDLATGALVSAGDLVAMTVSNTRYIWLDDRFVVKRDAELRPDPKTPWMYGFPIAERHVITQASVEGKYEIKLVDLDKPAEPLVVGTYPLVEKLDYNDQTKLLAIAHPRGIDRFAVDLATTTVERLEPLKARGSFTTARLLDPNVADGIVAVTVGWDGYYDDDSALVVWRQKGKRIVKKKLEPFSGQILAVDATGRSFILDRTGEVPALVVRHGIERVAKIEVPGMVHPLAVSADGSRIAYSGNHEIVMLDGRGKEQWRQPLWSTSQVLFSRDGSRLIARASGGFVSYDTATGVRIALECGWDFGVHATPTASNVPGAVPVCEDPTLQ